MLKQFHTLQFINFNLMHDTRLGFNEVCGSNENVIFVINYEKNTVY